MLTVKMASLCSEERYANPMHDNKGPVLLLKSKEIIVKLVTVN
jgi:hypothetical protein